MVERKLHTLMEVGLSYIRLGQSATTLSGGEAQRVKLSLELSKRDTGRTLYILDEPTSGLDPKARALLKRELKAQHARGRTVLMIAHRLSTIRHADAIAVVNKGVVDECGTHDELVAKKGGAYARLVAASGKGGGKSDKAAVDDGGAAA